MKKPLPEKIDELNMFGGNQITNNAVNQLITYLAELTTVVEGKQTGATIIANQYQEIPKYDGNAVSMPHTNNKEVEKLIDRIEKVTTGGISPFMKALLRTHLPPILKENLHQELQKAREQQNTVLLAYQMSLEAGNVKDVLTDIRNRINTLS